MSPSAKAPRWLVAMLSWVVPPDLKHEVVGDFEEVHRRRTASGSGASAGLVSAVEGLGLVAYWTGVRVLRALIHAAHVVSGTEVRLALRLVRKQPILNLTAVVALGVGIGMAAGAYSFFQQTLNGELPWEGGDRFATLRTFSDETGDRLPADLDLERMRLIRSSAPAIEYLGAIGGGEMNVVYPTGEIEPISGARLTPGFFAFLPYIPLEGRLFVPGDGGPLAPAVVLIRESLWERRFGRGPGVVGTDLDIGGVQHEIVGILDDEAGFPTEGEIWMPMDEESMGATSDRDPVDGRVLAILAPGATYEQATLQVNQLSAQVSVAGSGVEAQRHMFRPMTELLPGPQIERLALATMSFLLAVLLLIAFNVANLIMARTSSRAAELAVRSALGASRVRIVGQLFLEVLVITVLAGALGLTAAGGILEFYDGLIDELPFWVHLGISPGTVVVVGILSLIAAAVMGVLPGLRATGRNTADAIRSSGRGGSLGVGRVGGGMIAAEVALSVALIGAAVIFWRAFQDHSEPNFHLPAERVLAAAVFSVMDASDLPEGGAPTVSDSIRTLAASLSIVLNDLPQVRAATVASTLPPVQPGQLTVQLEGQAELVTARTVRTDPGLMETIEAETLSGRFLGLEDMDADAPPVVVVNRAFALQHFGTAEVVGARLRTVPQVEEEEEPGPWRQIVGVVPDVMEVATAGGGAGIYLPFTGQRFFYVAIRLDSDPLPFSSELRRVAFDLDPELTVAGVMRLDEVGSVNTNAMRVMSSVLVGVGLIALLLSLAGVYSIVALSVTQRTREIGVRVALGAEPARILWPLLRRSGLLILGGSLVGAILGTWVGQADGIFTFNLPDAGPLMFPALIALMVLAGVAACWIPARRALSIHPVEALRYDA
jgi:putative ABC transport system permease protein